MATGQHRRSRGIARARVMVIALVLLVVATITAPTAQAQGVDVDESDVAFITNEVEIARTDVEDFWDGDEHKTYRYGGVRVPPEARYFPDEFVAYIQRFPLANHPWSPGWVDDNVMWDRREAVYVPPRLWGDSDHWDIATTCLDQEVFAAVNLNWGVGRREVAGDGWPDDYREWKEPQLRDTSYSGWGDGRSTLHVEVALVETDNFGGHGGDCRRARCSGYVSRSSYDCDGVKRVSGFAEKETTSSTNVHFPTQRPQPGQWVTGQLTTHKVTVEISYRAPIDESLDLTPDLILAWHASWAPSQAELNALLSEKPDLAAPAITEF